MTANNDNPPAKKQVVGDAGINLQLTTNLFLGNVEMGEKIIGYLIEVGGVFVPEFFDGGELTKGRRVKFDPQDLVLVLKGWTHNRYSLGIIADRHNPIESSLHVSSTDFLMFDHLGLNVESKWFTDIQNISKFVSVAKGLYRLIQPNSGYIQNWRYERTIGEVIDSAGNLVGYKAPRTKWLLKGLFWANFFGPEYVDMFGRNNLLAAPWQRIETLSDGGVLAIISESPFDASRPECQARKQQLYDYLGKDAFSGDLLPKFRTEGRKKKDARPLMHSGGARDDIFH